MQKHRRTPFGSKILDKLSSATIASEHLDTVIKNVTLWMEPGVTAQSTLSTTESRVVKYLTWCLAAHVPAVPADEETWDRYVTRCRKSTGSNGTFIKLLDAVAWLHKMAEVPAPTFTQVQVLQNRKARRTGKLKAPKQARPLRYDELKKLMGARELNPSFQTAAAIGALSIMYYGAHRRSEIVDYRWDELTIDPDTGNGYITLKRAKNDQDGYGSERFIPAEVLGYLRRLHSQFGIDSPYLIPNGKVKGKGITAGTLSAWVRKYSVANGLDITTHSTRRGVVQDMLAQGFDAVAIADYVGWQGNVSDMVRHYSRGIAAKHSAAARLHSLQAV